jgi:hypothetical protein
MVFWAPVIGGFIILIIMYFIEKCINPQNISDDDNKKSLKINYLKIENIYDRPNKTMKLRTDFYSVTFMGYVYIDKEQRKEIILDDEGEEDEPIESEKTEAEKTQDKINKNKKKRLFFRNPLTGKRRKLTFNEAGRNFMICLFIFSIQLILTLTILKEISETEK